MTKRLIFVCTFWVFAVLPIQAQNALTFERAYEIAKNNSPDIRQAQFNLERQQQLLKAQEAGLKSRFSLVMTPFEFSRQREFNTFYSIWNTNEIKQSSGTFMVSQPLIWTDGTVSLRNQFSWRDAFTEFQNTRTKTFSNNLFLVYDQPIFTYNRTRLGLYEVELDLENARINYGIQELNLEQRVASSFYQAFKAAMDLQVAEEEFANRQQSFSIIKNKVEAGLAAKEELLQADLDLTGSRSSVQNMQVSLQNALDILKQNIGIQIRDDISVVANVAQETVHVDLQKAIDEGLKNRLELRQRKIDVEISKSNVIRSGATNEFRGNISLSYGIIGNNEELKDVYLAPTRNQTASISFEIPIWDWGEQEARIKASEASVQGTKLNLSEQKKSILVAIRRSYRELQNLAIQVELAQKNVENAQLTYEINLERYENGDLTSMDLNLFQNQLSQKKTGLIDAIINYKLAVLDMKIQTLWDFRHNRPALNLDSLTAEN